MNWIVLLNDSTLAVHRGFSFGKLKYYFRNKLEIKMPEDLNEALISACREGNIIEVKRLLAEGADVNAIDYAMQTPIWKAVRSRNVELVKLLIKNGARVKIGDENRETPIAYAETLGFRSSDELYNKR